MVLLSQKSKLVKLPCFESDPRKGFLCGSAVTTFSTSGSAEREITYLRTSGSGLWFSLSWSTWQRRMGPILRQYLICPWDRISVVTRRGHQSPDWIHATAENTTAGNTTAAWLRGEIDAIFKLPPFFRDSMAIPPQRDDMPRALYSAASRHLIGVLRQPAVWVWHV